MAIYITGDTHRDFDKIQEFCEFYGTSREDDVIIILGDAGINYYLNNSDQDVKEDLSTVDITFFCIHGNHEERPYMIETYEETQWHGGTVYIEPEYPNLIFAKDGEIYDFDGKKAIVIGGAYSIDKFVRLRCGEQWFETEQPDEEIMQYVEKQLDRIQWQVNYVFSHTAPSKYEPREEFIPGMNQALVDKSTEKWLDEIENKLTYERWFLGHYHCDKRIGNVTIMYNEFEELY